MRTKVLTINELPILYTLAIITSQIAFKKTVSFLDTARLVSIFVRYQSEVLRS